MFPFVLLGLAFYILKRATSNRIVDVEIGPVTVHSLQGAPMFSKRKFSSLVKGVNWKKAQKLAKVYGPAVAAVYPPAGVALAAVNGLQSKARAGDPVALAKMGVIAKAAQAGNPQAIATVKALSTLSTVRDAAETDNDE